MVTVCKSIHRYVSYAFDFFHLRVSRTEMCINTTVVKMSAIPVCKVTKLVYRDCWCGTVLCLNIPQPTINERIVCFANFKSLLGQNSLFVYPIISELEEDDDFVMDTSSGRTCNIFELADRRFRTENLDISFLRQNTSSNKRGVSILLAKKNEVYMYCIWSTYNIHNTYNTMYAIILIVGNAITSQDCGKQ